LGGESREECLLGLPVPWSLAGHDGKKRAVIAVDHSMLVILYHMMRAGASYAYLGDNLFDHLGPDRLTRYYVIRLERLGRKVTVETNAAA
jgi:hypothetical protein